MSNPTNPKGGSPFAPTHKVKLCGLYKQKRKKDGKIYLVGRNSFSSKFLILPNDEKKSDSEPDFWIFAIEDEVKPKAPLSVAAPDDEGL